MIFTFDNLKVYFVAPWNEIFEAVSLSYLFNLTMMTNLSICQINHLVNSNQKRPPQLKRQLSPSLRAIQVPLVKKTFFCNKKTHIYFHIISRYHRSFSCECSWFSTLWPFVVIWGHYSNYYKKGKNENKLTIHQGNPWSLNALKIKLFSLNISCSDLRKIK